MGAGADFTQEHAKHPAAAERSETAKGRSLCPKGSAGGRGQIPGTALKILRCSNSLFHALVLALCVPSARAADKPSQKTQPDAPRAAGVLRPESRTFTVSELRDIRLNASTGHFTFTVGETTYIYGPNSEHNSGANVSACVAVLAEFRRVKTFEATVVIPPKETKTYRIHELIIPVGELK